VSNGVELSVSLPLDADGFLRRECPTCEREFKWRHSEDEGESEPMADSGYFCPYCAVQAPPESWFTKPQQALVESTIHRKVVGPALDEFGRSLRDISRRSAGFQKVDRESERQEPSDPLTEPDDMRRVDFGCHPREPVKVLEDWNRAVHCLICGAPANA
jgi:DNA-directed RNA polymerase subunit RPC12/RpoP